MGDHQVFDRRTPVEQQAVQLRGAATAMVVVEVRLVHQPGLDPLAHGVQAPFQAMIEGTGGRIEIVQPAQGGGHQAHQALGLQLAALRQRGQRVPGTALISSHCRPSLWVSFSTCGQSMPAPCSQRRRAISAGSSACADSTSCLTNRVGRRATSRRWTVAAEHPSPCPRQR